MVAAERGTVDEVDVPLPLDMGPAAAIVVRIGVRVPAEPEVDRARMFGQIALEGLRVRLIVEPISSLGWMCPSIRLL